MKTSIIFVMMLSVSALTAASEQNNNTIRDIYLIENPSERMIRPNEYFADEYLQINGRRGLVNKSERPEFITGLAFSGGGIRSSAYQLGILSGLYKNKKSLGQIDYISSVSGGSWANGAYWASTLSDDELFGCLDKAATLGVSNAECKAAGLLNNEQPFAELPVNGTKLQSRKRQWKEYIESVYLSECNVNAEEVKVSGIDPRCTRNYRQKPYIIVNATHSVPFNKQGGDESHVPFQFTLDYIGTLADCFQPGECGENKNKGFFVRTLSRDFAWVNKSAFRDDKPQNSLSAALAASSGVASGTALLSYDYELLKDPRMTMLGNYRGTHTTGTRERYSLSDGGKSDNLGLVPLVERGVNLIVISYMGKDANLVQNPWEDLDLSAKQVENLLKCKVEVPDKTADVTTKYIHKTTYSCSGKAGTILHVKASYDNAKKFIAYLENSGLNDLAQYLAVTDIENHKSDPKNRFPQTKTMMQRYDEELVRAYYLFGQWIASNQLSQEIDKYQSQDK